MNGVDNRNWSRGELRKPRPGKKLGKTADEPTNPIWGRFRMRVIQKFVGLAGNFSEGLGSQLTTTRRFTHKWQERAVHLARAAHDESDTILTIERPQALWLSPEGYLFCHYLRHLAHLTSPNTDSRVTPFGNVNEMLIDCDKNMIVHLLRNWHPNRLRPQGVRLAKERPRLMTLQNGVCPLCPEPLVNDGKVTHIDHIVTVKEFSVRVLQGELTFDDAYRQLWEDSNLRAVHRKCNYDRNVDAAKVKAVTAGE